MYKLNAITTIDPDALVVIGFPFCFLFIFTFIVFSLPYLSLEFHLLKNELACDKCFFAVGRGNSDDN